MKSLLLTTLLACGHVLASVTSSAGATLRVKPTESLSTVRDKLASDAGITEVVFEDYNNYGTALREQPAGTKFDSLTPRTNEDFLSGGSKAIVNYSEYRGEGKRYVSLDEWRAFSGLDQHTLFADPLYRDSRSRDFGLEPNSPNRGAGAGRATIGALGGKDDK